MTAGGPRVVLFPDAARQIERRARMSPARETGGLLLGCRVADDIYAVDALEVRDRGATRSRYVLGKRAADAALEGYLADLPDDSPVGYVGLWHTHLACAGPSFTDRLTLRREAAALTDVVALLVVARCTGGWKSYACVSAKRRAWRRIAVAQVDYPSGSSGNGSPLGGGNDGST